MTVTTKARYDEPSFWKAAAARALWTFAQTFLATGGVASSGFFSASILDVLLTAAAACVISVAKSIVAGMPEVDES